MLPNRRSIRMKGWDYATPGWYFITICTQDMRPMFGTVVNGRMVPNTVGRIAAQMWLAVAAYHPEYRLDEFVVMPNHVHGLVHVSSVGGHNGPPLRNGPSLPDFVRRYKSTVDVAWRKAFVGAGRWACPSLRNNKLWQRNYWDVIVRNDRALATIREYIRNNPQNYQAVMSCGAPKCLGDRSLLEHPKVGFLASRGAAMPHGILHLRPDEAILSGFLSPMERQVFAAGLARKTHSSG